MVEKSLGNADDCGVQTLTLRASLSQARSLFLASVLALFVELTLIRWIPNTVHVVAFFANLVLIASFLGLGIGMAQPGREAVRTGAIRLGLLVVGISALGIAEPSAALSPVADYAVNEDRTGFALPLAVVLVGVFVAVAWALIPFGRLVAARFDQLERIHAYSTNILGSLVGVVGFALLSWVSAPPYLWFAACFLVLALLGGSRQLVVWAVAVGVALFGLHYFDSDGFKDEVSWSPYYKLSVHAVDEQLGPAAGFVVDVNNQFLLSGLDLRPEATGGSPGSELADQIEASKSYYNFPFELSEAADALVLGAGAGNDVAAGIRHGLSSVIAVEIDPKVLQLGIEQHPEAPYQKPGVQAVLDDARAFLRTSTEQFDLILFATLDAHGLISTVGSVRLDSFVYTRESLESARDHLSPNGLLVLSFGPFREDIQYRQFDMVRDVFGQEPLYFEHSNRHRTIVAGAIEDLVPTLRPEWRAISGSEIADGFVRYPYAQEPATDDWPHLYLRDRGIPREYIAVLGLAMIMSLLMIGTNLRGARRIDPQMFFLGAGFLLMETKSVTEYALLVGSTWLTNAIVFSMILTVILVANLAVLRGWVRISLRILYALLGISLVAQFIWPVSSWASGSRWSSIMLATVHLGVPITLASTIFALLFRRTRVGSVALASNLLGAVLGGVAEYLSLVFGLRALSLVALAMYGAAFVAFAFSSKTKLGVASA